MDAALSLPTLPLPQTSGLVSRLANVHTQVRSDLDDSKVDPRIRAKLHKSAEDFESQFVSQMLGHMFEGIPVDDTFGGGKGEEMFRSTLINEYGKQVTRRGGFGIADQVYRELIRAQEASHGQG